MAQPQQLGGAAGRLDHQLARQLLVETGFCARVGQRLHRQRQIRRGAAHHRRRRVEVGVRKLEDVAEEVEHLPDLGAQLASHAEDAPPHLDRDIRHDPSHGRLREDGLNSLQRGGSEQRYDCVRPLQLLGGGLEHGRLHCQDEDVRALGELGVRADGVPTDLGRQTCRPPGPRVREEHAVDVSSQAAGHRRGHAARPTKPHNHVAQTSRALTGGSGAQPTRGGLFSAPHPRPENRLASITV